MFEVSFSLFLCHVTWVLNFCTKYSLLPSLPTEDTLSMAWGSHELNHGQSLTEHRCRNPANWKLGLADLPVCSVVLSGGNCFSSLWSAVLWDTNPFIGSLHILTVRGVIAIWGSGNILGGCFSSQVTAEPDAITNIPQTNLEEHLHLRALLLPHPPEVLSPKSVSSKLHHNPRLWVSAFCRL